MIALDTSFPRLSVLFNIQMLLDAPTWLLLTPVCRNFCTCSSGQNCTTPKKVGKSINKVFKPFLGIASLSAFHVKSRLYCTGFYDYIKHISLHVHFSLFSTKRYSTQVNSFSIKVKKASSTAESWLVGKGLCCLQARIWLQMGYIWEGLDGHLERNSIQ